MTETTNTTNVEPRFINQNELRLVPNTLAVYRNLRIGMGMTAIMLAASIIVQSTYVEGPTGKNCWQGALSEYFYTSAHSIFVAALLGLATLFFVYRGSSDTENALLTLAGVAAFTAALVPQGEGYIDRCTPLFIPDDVEVANVIRPNLVAFVVALAVAWLITLCQRYYNNRIDQFDDPIRQQISSGGKLARGVVWVVVVFGLIALCFPQFDSRDIAHAAAGFLLLTSLIATVFATAFLAGREETTPRSPRFQRLYRRFYWAWAVFMTVTFVGIIAVHCLVPEFFKGLWGTYVESAVLLEFCVYWVVQTFDLWDDPDRRYRMSDPDQRRLGPVPSHEEPENTSFGDKVMAFL